MNTRPFLAFFLCLTSFAVQAHDYTLGAIKIGHPWARATAPGAPAGGGFMRLSNGGGADRLVAASAAVADSVELHSMSIENNVMHMRKLDKGLDLPAGETVELKPGGFHIMFVGLKAPLKEGDRFPLKLKFEKAGEVTVDVKIEGMAGGAAVSSEHEHKH